MKTIKSGFIIPEILSPYFEDSIPEKTLIDWVKSEIKGDTFLDIGAHVGTWSIKLAENFSSVWAFEPQKDIYNCLCGNIAINELSHKISTRNVAIGSIYGTQILQSNTKGGGEASLIIKGDFKESVTVERLDLHKFKGISLIKIDVEGNELDVLKGGVSTLIDNNFPPIFFECWQDERGQRRRDLLDFITELGYTVSSINCYPEMYLAKR